MGQNKYKEQIDSIRMFYFIRAYVVHSIRNLDGWNGDRPYNKEKVTQIHRPYEF